MAASRTHFVPELIYVPNAVQIAIFRFEKHCPGLLNFEVDFHDKRGK